MEFIHNLKGKKIRFSFFYHANDFNHTIEVPNAKLRLAVCTFVCLCIVRRFFCHGSYTFKGILKLDMDVFK